MAPFLYLQQDDRKLLPSFRHLPIRLVPLFVLLLELRVESLRFLGEGLVKAGVAHLAHEEVLEVAAWLFGVELERVPAFDGELLLFLGLAVYCGKEVC